MQPLLHLKYELKKDLILKESDRIIEKKYNDI